MSDKPHPSDLVRAIIKKDFEELQEEAKKAATTLMQLSERAKTRRDVVVAFSQGIPVFITFSPSEDRRAAEGWDEILWAIKNLKQSCPEIRSNIEKLADHFSFFDSFSRFISAMGTGSALGVGLGGTLSAAVPPRRAVPADQDRTYTSGLSGRVKEG